MTTLAGTNAWVLSNDEATVAEQAEVKEKEDKVLLRNKEFEKNKEEFCTNFITDMEDRKKKNSHCQEEARECGRTSYASRATTVCFKAKKFESSLELYMDALKVTPYDVKILINIAQASIKLKHTDVALEFLAQTLFIDACPSCQGL